MDKFLSNNTVLRVLAVILSIILWFSVQSPSPAGNAGASGMDKFPFPVKVETSSGLVVTSVQPSTAVVAVSDSLVNLPQLSEQMLNVDLVANARGLAPGTHQLTLAALHMPPVRHTIEPATVTVTIAKRKTVTHSVKVQLEGAPHDGYTAGTPALGVTSVQLSGAESALKSVSQVVAEVDIEGATQDLSEQVSLLPVDSNGQPVEGVTVDPATATVSVPISAPQATAQVTPSITGTPEAGYAVAGVTLSPSSVTVFGPGAPVQLPVPVDVSGLSASQTEKITVPVTGSLQKISPSQVIATIQIDPSAARTFSAVTIQVQNTPTGKTVTFPNDSTVDIGVTGPNSIIKGLSNSDIVPYIDVEGLGPGTHTVPIQVKHPDWVHVTQLSHTKVTISIR